MLQPTQVSKVEIASGMGFTCCLLGALCYARAKHRQPHDVRSFEGQRLRCRHSRYQKGLNECEGQKRKANILNEEKPSM